MGLYKKHNNIAKKRHFQIVFVLVCCLFLFGVGYSILSQRLDITGTAKITTNWDVYISSIAQTTMSNAETVGTPKVTNKTNGSIEVNLNKKGGYATYKVTVKNAGNVDAIVTNISGINEANRQEPVDIKVSTSVTKNTTLLAGGTMYFTITIKWDSSVTTTSTAMNKTINFAVEYQQKTEANTPEVFPKDLATTLSLGGSNSNLSVSGNRITGSSAGDSGLSSSMRINGNIGEKFKVGSQYEVTVTVTGTNVTFYGSMCGAIALKVNGSLVAMSGAWSTSGLVHKFRFTVPSGSENNTGEFAIGTGGTYFTWKNFYSYQLASVTVQQLS